MPTRSGAAEPGAQQQYPSNPGLLADIPLYLLQPALVKAIQKHKPEIAQRGSISLADLDSVHSKWLHHVFIKEHTRIEGKSIDPEDLRHPEMPDLHAEFGYSPSRGEKIADRVARFGGSWTFIIVFSGLLVIWVVLNTVQLLGRPFDPFPFILLNLMLSTTAALQAPVIMMSQNRQEQRDRLRSEHDFQINLRAEIELRSLHQKVDRLLAHQWAELAAISKAVAAKD